MIHPPRYKRLCRKTYHAKSNPRVFSRMPDGKRCVLGIYGDTPNQVVHRAESDMWMLENIAWTIRCMLIPA